MAGGDTFTLLSSKGSHFLDTVRRNPVTTCLSITTAVLLTATLTLAVLLAAPESRTAQLVVTEPPVHFMEDIWDDPKNMTLLLLVGGATSDPYGHAEVVDLSGQFKGCNWGVPLPFKSVGHATAVRYRGHPVVCGGRGVTDSDPVHDECWLLDNGNWTLLGKMNERRSSHAAVNIREDIFWVAGGVSNEKILSTTEIFSGIKGHFEPGPVLPVLILDQCFIKLNLTHYGMLGGRALLNNAWAESDRFYVFDSETQIWIDFPSMGVPRRELACGVITHPERGLELVAAGGYNDLKATSEIFNFRNGTWREGPPLPKPVRNPESVPFKDTFLVVNGWRWVDNTLTHTIQRYDIEVNQWEQINEHTQEVKNGQVAMMVSDKTAPCAGHGHVFG